MASTRKYDLNQMNQNTFIKLYKKEKPKLNQQSTTAVLRDDECERLATNLINSIQNALEQSTPKLFANNNNNSKSRSKTFLYKIPRNTSDLFNVSKSLLSENRRQYRQNSSNNNSYRTSSNYSKRDFFEKQLAYYVGDQCSNNLVNKKVSKPSSTNPIDPNVIRDLITKLPSYKLPGLDFIPNEVWQCILKYDDEYLIQFLNTLIRSLYFPTEFKRGKLIVFRKPNRSGFDPQNYRFITVETAICKIFEKLIVYKLSNDENLKNYLNSVTSQHGFTKGKSRYSAINLVVSEIRKIQNKNEYGILIQLDLRRAFDLISWNHILLVAEKYLDKEKFILIAQLLKGRTIQLNDYERKTHRGIPQGSPSSHLLWLIGTSDLFLNLSSISNLVSVGFVDDLMLVVKGRKVTEVLNKVDEIKVTVENWLNSACLELNETKCFYMQFSGHTKINLRKLQINQVKLRSTDSLKYLGVHLNSELDFEGVIFDIQRRIKDAIKAIQIILAYRPEPLNYEDRLQIYYRAVKPIMTNAWSIWAKDLIDSKFLTDKLRNAQKRCLVALFNESDVIRNAELCRKHQILPIDIELQLKICKQMAGQKKRGGRLTKQEEKYLLVEVMQANNFHW